MMLTKLLISAKHMNGQKKNGRGAFIGANLSLSRSC